MLPGISWCGFTESTNSMGSWSGGKFMCDRCNWFYGWSTNGRVSREDALQACTEHDNNAHGGGGGNSSGETNSTENMMNSAVQSVIEQNKLMQQKKEADREAREADAAAEEAERQRQHENARQREYDNAKQQAYSNYLKARQSCWVGPVRFDQIPLWDDETWFYGLKYQATNTSAKSYKVRAYLTESNNVEDSLAADIVNVAPGASVYLGYCRRNSSSLGWDAAPKFEAEERVSSQPSSARRRPAASTPRIGGGAPQMLRGGAESELTEKNIRAMPVPELWENLKRQKFSDPTADDIKNRGINLLAKEPEGRAIMDKLVLAGVPVEVGVLSPGLIGAFDRATGKITINQDFIKGSNFNETDFVLVLAHEGHHALQAKDGLTVASFEQEREAHLEHMLVYDRLLKKGAPRAKDQGINADYATWKGRGDEAYLQVVQKRYDYKVQMGHDKARARSGVAVGWINLSAHLPAYRSGKTTDDMREQELWYLSRPDKSELKKIEEHEAAFMERYRSAKEKGE